MGLENYILFKIIFYFCLITKITRWTLRAVGESFTTLCGDQIDLGWSGEDRFQLYIHLSLPQEQATNQPKQGHQLDKM